MGGAPVHALCVMLTLACSGPSAAPPDAAVPPDAARGDAGSSREIADLVRIDEVVLTQGVEIALARGGALVEPRNAPVVAGRVGLLRALVTPLDGPVALHATLEVERATGTISISIDAELDVPSDRGVLGTTLDLALSPEAVTTDAAVVLTITADGADGALRWPSTGAYPLAARSALAPLRISFVPFTIDGLTPTLGATQLESYRSRLMDLYPVDEVVLDVLPSEPFAGDLCTPAGWFDLSVATLARRAADAPADGVFYSGLAQLRDFRCTSIGGLAESLEGVTDPARRAFVAYAMDPATLRDSATFVAHELGHVLGRSHAPCGAVVGPDSSFPYENALIGVWGYSASRNQLFDPALYSDLMGYCAPPWISDYQYSALFDAIVTVHTNEAMP